MWSSWSSFSSAVTATVSLFHLAHAIPTQIPLISGLGNLDAFTTYSHPIFHTYQLRVKQPSSDICSNGGVNSWSGWLDDLEKGKHYYFWAFESRSEPSNDPLVLWMNGGPGCSSFAGNLMEKIGPCMIASPNHTIPNPHSWTNNANMIFLDQVGQLLSSSGLQAYKECELPVGVGFSYSDNPITGSWTTEAASKDFYAFLQLFYSAFPQFLAVPFHISGESYAGRYIPLFAEYLLKQNLALHHRPGDEDMVYIPLESVLIGNGWTSVQEQHISYYPTLCTNVTGHGPYLTEEQCAEMESKMPTCKRVLEVCFRRPFIPALCNGALAYCEDIQFKDFTKTGRNVYDMEKFGEYEEDMWVQQFLNRPEVQDELGVAEAKKSFTGCDEGVGAKFLVSGDGGKSSTSQIITLLESGINVLIYVGATDLVCGWVGNYDWTLNLPWFGTHGFNVAPFKPFYAPSSNEEEGVIYAGEIKSYENLALVKIVETGHFVPYKKPRETLELINAWLNDGTRGLMTLKNTN